MATVDCCVIVAGEVSLTDVGDTHPVTKIIITKNKKTAPFSGYSVISNLVIELRVIFLLE
jgi:hypothetical protein